MLKPINTDYTLINNKKFKYKKLSDAVGLFIINVWILKSINIKMKKFLWVNLIWIIIVTENLKNNTNGLKKLTNGHLRMQFTIWIQHIKNSSKNMLDIQSLKVNEIIRSLIKQTSQTITSKYHLRTAESNFQNLNGLKQKFIENLLEK